MSETDKIKSKEQIDNDLLPFTLLIGNSGNTPVLRGWRENDIIADDYSSWRPNNDNRII